MPLPAPITRRTVDVDGIEVFYREAGPADAPVGDVDRAQVYAAADRAQARVGIPVNPVVASKRRWEDASDALIRQIKASPTVDLSPAAVSKEAGG
ncbi:hypothetical protein [Thermoactinospora rubra]|uniref:hypothetical protein n=1 Tax=Thermoactinospora rubra TaxID=1088767 RepID=UPI000A1048D6|nr:hypothetical protein [Thermoactinospora rubra]